MMNKASLWSLLFKNFMIIASMEKAEYMSKGFIIR